MKIRKILEKEYDCSGEEEKKAGISNSSKNHITTTKVERFREAGQDEVDPRRYCSGDLGRKGGDGTNHSLALSGDTHQPVIFTPPLNSSLALLLPFQEVIGKDSMGSHVCAWAYTHLPMYLYMYVCIPHREMEKKKIVLEYELKELNDSLKKVENKINSIMEEKEDVIKEVESKRALLEIREREYNQLVKLLELTRENEATSLTERLVIFLCICHPNLSSVYI